MPDQRPWTGFPPDQAVWRLLRRKGYQEGFADFKESLWSGASPEQMVAALAGQGLQGRVSQVVGRDLRYLEWPTLVELAGGTWILLEGRWAETPEGIRPLNAETLAEHGTGRVLDLVGGLPPGPSCGARWKALLLCHPLGLVQLGAAALMLQILALATPAGTAIMLDRVLPNGDRAAFWLVLAGIVLATCHQAMIGWLQDRLALHLLTRLSVGAERGFLEHLLRCPFPFLQSRTQGELLQAFAGFAAIRDLLPARTVSAVLNGALGLLCLGAMAFLLPALSLLVLAATGLYALLAFLPGRAIARFQARQMEAEARENGLLSELVTGIATLRAAGAEDRVLERWRCRRREVLALEWARGRIKLGSELAMVLLGHALTVVMCILGGKGLLAGTMEVGRFFAFLQLSTGFTAALTAIVQTSLAIARVRPQFEPVRKILATATEPASRETVVTPAASVLLEGIWFRYVPEGPWVLQDFSLRIEPGEKRRLEGPSGFGKSTVLRIMAGLYAPNQGRVAVAGRPPSDARNLVTYLPQFARIFGGSILDNLRIFSHGADLKKLLEIAGRTGLQHWVETLPMGYQTLLTTGGRSLSGGQRQLIALTGALASGRPLLLLDEALANLDPGHAGPIQKLLANGPWTVVAASHTPVAGFGH